MLSAQEHELLWLLEQKEGVASLLDFIPRTSKGYSAPAHLSRLADAFMRAETQPVRVCVATPPRHAKTESILHWLVRYLKRYPDRKVAYVTYAQDLSDKWSRKAMRFADAAGLRLAVKNLNRWMTAEGGEFLFTSVEGGIVGNGYNVVVVDDPYKGRAQAESLTVNENIYDWFKAAARTRLEPGASVFVVHHRWTKDDLIGRLLQEGYEDLTFPAISDGQPLWPERWSLEELERTRLEVTSREWASLYMGSPVAEDGVLFSAEVPRFSLAKVSDITAGATLAIGVDPAATASTKADFSVIAVVATKGVGVAQQFWLVDLWRGQVTIPDLVKRIQEMQTRHHKAPVYVEAVAGFKAVPDMLRSIDPQLRVYNAPVNGDKYTRALPLAAAWEHGRFHLPESAAWLGPVLTEFRAFTGKNDPHDDIVDAVAHAIAALAKAAPPVRRYIPAGIGY